MTPPTPSTALREALHDFAMTYRVESRETREEDLQKILLLVEADKKKAVEEALVLYGNDDQDFLERATKVSKLMFP